MAHRTDCIILGGGASGLTACAYLADRGLHVTVVEQLDRVGKKLMASGNGRCNLSNTRMDSAYYGDASAFVRRVYGQTPPEEVYAFFSSLGLMMAEEDGRLYPRTMMASSVLDVLRNACAKDWVKMRTGCRAVSLSPSRRGGWSVQLENGEGLFAPVVLCAMGGSASPQLGTDGAGTRMLSRLGHSITPLYPALVQLKCSHSALPSLKGIRVQAALTLLIDDQPACQESGELLFTDYGVSGVCVFQLSRHAAKATDARRQVRLLINLLPEIPAEETQNWLHERVIRMQHADALTLFTGVFPRLLTLALLKESCIAPDTPVSLMNDAQLHAMAKTIGAFSLPITGTQGMKNAQVTAGGVDLEEIAPDTMASALYDGLYLAGEITDVDGPCGGYNLHFAFASALTAAKAICAGFES